MLDGFRWRPMKSIDRGTGRGDVVVNNVTIVHDVNVISNYRNARSFRAATA
jgi:hypothetical protein